MSTHPNSRKITLFRANNFIQKAQNFESNEELSNYMSLTQLDIGPYLESNAAKIIGSGLSIKEQELLMPLLLNLGPEDRDFRKSVFDFFNSLKTKVPFSTGKDLEIGLEVDNDKPVSKDNMPISIENYVRYRHALKHPWVAKSKAEADGNQLKHFFIYDPELEHKESSDRVVLQDKAASIWLQVKSNESKVTMLLTLLGKDERDYVGRNGSSRKQTDLHALVVSDATRFLKVYEEDRFEIRYWLRAMILAGVVKIVGTTYIISETQKKLGASELEAILYLEDDKGSNADTISYLKGMTQDILRKPKVNRKKLTP